jgi:hypothetical protein
MQWADQACGCDLAEVPAMEAALVPDADREKRPATAI